MGDFPRPFSGNKTKKQSKDHFKKFIEEASILTSAGKPEEMPLFEAPNVGKLPAKEAPRKKTKEMGGPNMKAPLEKALVGNQQNLNEGLKAAIEASPATMISTGMAGVDPMTGMPQANQLTPTAINPNALGSMQPQIPSIAGTPQAGSYNNVMPQPAQTGLAAPLNLGKPVAKKPNYTMPEKTKYAKPPRKLYKDVDGVVKDEDGKDAGYPIIRQSSSSTKGYVK